MPVGPLRGACAVSFAAVSATDFCSTLGALMNDDWGLQFDPSATQNGELPGAGLWPLLSPS